MKTLIFNSQKSQLSAAEKISSASLKYLGFFFNSSCFLLAISIVFILFEFVVGNVYSMYFGVFDLTKTSCLIFYALYTLVWIFAAPVLVTKLFMKESLKELGLAFPKNKKLAVFLVLFTLLLLLPWFVYFSTLTSFQRYSLGSPSVIKFLVIISTFFPVYYFAEEFFFRGFLFIGLWNRLGWHSFWITDIIFTLTHLGKPWLEVLMCIPVSIIFNLLTLYTRSIFPAMAVHFTLGVVLSLFVNFNL